MCIYVCMTAFVTYHAVLYMTVLNIHGMSIY